jgi:hypothetical protein
MDSYRIVTRMTDLVHRVQRNPTSTMIVIHLNRLASYQGIVGTSGPKEGAAGAVGETVIVRTDPRTEEGWTKAKTVEVPASARR